MTEPTVADCPTVGEIPALGLGTWQNTDEEACAESVRTALEAGYRHIDTAQAYGNEESVGVGIERADVDRDEIFLATKVWTSNLAPEDVHETARASLDRLGVESVDLLYVHWPAEAYEPEPTLTAFDELREAGLIDRIGVSNFEPEQLDRAREILGDGIAANQVECHPMLQQEKLRTYADDHDVPLVAYSPLARGDVFDVDVLSEIADDHGVSEAQVSLAWLRERGVAAIPKATGAEHVRDNWRSLTLELSEDELARIDAIEESERRVDPDFAPW